MVPHDPELPYLDISELDQLVLQTTELYQAYLKSDEFAPKQALYLTAAFMNGTPGTAP